MRYVLTQYITALILPLPRFQDQTGALTGRASSRRNIPFTQMDNYCNRIIELLQAAFDHGYNLALPQVVQDTCYTLALAHTVRTYLRTFLSDATHSHKVAFVCSHFLGRLLL